MPPTPASTAASTQLAAARASGDHPSSATAVSSSAMARLARPKRVNRDRAHSPAAARTTTAASRSRSRGTSTPSTDTGDDGRRPGTGRLSVPNHRTATAWRTASRPTEATTLASAGARRKGRNTRPKTSSPSTADRTTLVASDAHSPIRGRSSTKA